METETDRKASRAEQDRPDRYRTTADLVMGLAWPMLVLGILLAYNGPVGEAIQLLLAKLERANRVEVGGLQFEIVEQARASGNPELVERLQGVRPDEVRLLLETGRSHVRLVGMRDASQTFSLPDRMELGALRALEARGLIRFEEPLNEFLSWLHGESFLSVRPAEGIDEMRLHFKARGDLNDREAARLRNQSYQLTPLGKSAWESVLGAINQQLAAPGGGL